MEKSPDAFRTISEVADWLGVPTHVLRFWESRFPQVKPVKRAGGRRYYRPSDMALLGGIKRLLHDDGMTIRGVQKMLREEGVRHVSSYSQPLDAAAPMRDVTPAEDEEEEVAPSPMAVDVEPEPLDNVVPLAAAPELVDEDALARAPARREEAGPPAAPELVDEATLSPAPERADAAEPDSAPDLIDEDTLAPAPARIEEAELPPAPELVDEATLSPAPASEPIVLGGEAPPPTDAVRETVQAAPPEEAAPLAPASDDREEDASAEEAAEADEPLPELSFLRRPAAAPGSVPGPASEPAPVPGSGPGAEQPDLFSSRRAAEPAPPRPRIPATPDVPPADAPDDDAATPAHPGVAARLVVNGIRPDHAAIARAMADLRALRARL